MISLLLPILAGLALALMGLAYRIGQAKGVSPDRIILSISLCGSAFFLVRWMSSQSVHPRAALLGLAAGVANYGAVKLMGPALARGPFSPVWAALSMGFVPVIAYTLLTGAEAITQWQAAGALVAVGSVLVASTLQAQGPSTARRRTVRDVSIYVGLLLGIMVLNGAPQIGIKDLASHIELGQTLMDRHGDLFFLCLYAGLFASSLLAASRASKVPWKPFAFTSMLAVAGSLTLMLTFRAAASLPAAVVFTISSSLSLVLACGFSVAFYKERAGLRWWGAMLMGIAAIVLSAL